jgi:hypothetical protein
MNRKVKIGVFNFVCNCCTGGERDTFTETEMDNWDDFMKWLDEHEPDYIYIEEYEEAKE